MATEISAGREELDALFSSVYEQLREVAHRIMASRADLTLQPTGLVHELYAKLAAQTGANWRGREHFLRAAAKLMRRVLVDAIRARRAAKRDAGRRRPLTEYSAAVLPDIDVLDLHNALEALEKGDPQAAEVVEMKYFGGMTNQETAEALGVSRATIDRKWAFARSVLYHYLRGNNVLASLNGHDPGSRH